MQTFLFYDIETSGLNKCFDQVIEFAAIRTDLDFNEIERHHFYVKLSKDTVPSPGAFITHRIGLDKLEQGLFEHDAINKIHTIFNKPGTISLGYNTLGFDDEFLRFSFAKCLLPPYTHQYQNNCARMDLYPLTVLYFLYNKDVLQWPYQSGKVSFKLENIAKQKGKGIWHKDYYGETPAAYKKKLRSMEKRKVEVSEPIGGRRGIRR